ncbi:MAG: tRNA dihydrouridine(20/20a) synthase DusA [Gammaproteobacteria bacterium]|nr:MAG: tRNA dihydrouridine(20/20a) synthase DusA [Gammaproteobacteria bacterium]
MTKYSRRFCVAPMLDWTDRHERYFLRLISRHAWLYTEMLTTGAVIHGDRERLLGMNECERPVALQLGGSDPAAMAQCARIGVDHGYDEININVGCPSDRVLSGQFGACLMARPELVAECVAAMTAEVNVPVTVKSRIGIDHQDSYQELERFVSTVAGAGCGTFIIHARKAWLQGLSPKENRDIPPLQYDTVFRIKQDFPGLEIIINGGITGLARARELLSFVDGVMLGRKVYHEPWLLAQVDQLFYGADKNDLTREEVVRRYMPYMQSWLDKGVKLSSMTRHILGLYQGQPGARIWRRCLSENAHKKGAGVEVVVAALDRVREVQETVRKNNDDRTGQ